MIKRFCGTNIINNTQMSIFIRQLFHNCFGKLQFTMTYYNHQIQTKPRNNCEMKGAEL